MTAPAAAKPRLFRPVVRVTAGNFLEMYDFQVFGYYAAAIAHTFFPGGSEFASLMLSLATFGAGFLMRPLGAIVLGAYVDHRGRRDGLLLTLGLMAIGTFSIAVTPSYAAIGIVAPLLVLAGRLVQGLSAGVENGGVSVYLSEIAATGRKGFFVAWQTASQQVGVMFTAAIGLALTTHLSAGQMTRWGWRIPFLIGCAIIPLVFLLRRSLEETPEFQRQRPPLPREIFRTLAAHWTLIFRGMMLTTMTTVSFYMITAYTPTFGSAVLHLAPKDNMIVTFCVGASNFFWIPLAGALSDRIGRRPMLIAITIAALATVYPGFVWLAAAPSFARLMTLELWLSFLFGTYNAPMVTFLTEIMPSNIRTTGFSLAYSCATAFFGGFTPAISTYLIHITGSRAVPGLWLSFAAACGLIATLLTKSEAGQPARRAATGARSAATAEAD